MHDLRLASDVCFVTVMLGSAEAIIMLTNLLLDFLLDRIKLISICLLFVLWIRLVWLGLNSCTRRNILTSSIGR